MVFKYFLQVVFSLLTCILKVLHGEKHSHVQIMMSVSLDNIICDHCQ